MTSLFHDRIAGFATFIATARISRLNRRHEAAFILLLIVGQFWFARGLFLGELTFKHDSVLWYGMFHYFTESLWNGDWPLWNPYVHGGEPFYYAWNILRLTDPVTLATILAAAPFEPDLFLLYNVNSFIRIAVACIGVYLVLRTLLTRVLSLMACAVVIFWGGLGGFELHYIASMDAFCWFPWVFWGLLKALGIKTSGEESIKRRGRWILLTFWFFAITVGGAVYHWVYVAYILVVFLLFVLVFSRRQLTRAFAENRKAIIQGLLLVTIMSTPLLALFLERGEMYPAARNLYRHEAQTGVSKILGVDYDKIAKRDLQVGLGDLLLITSHTKRRGIFPRWAASS